MKFWSIITLMVFLNFTALPGIAAVLSIDLPQTNVVINEEENHSGSIIIYEKSIPETLQLKNHLQFPESEAANKLFFSKNDERHCSPFLTLFSPPPEA